MAVEITQKKLYELYCEKLLNDKEIGDLFGLHHQKICKLRKKYGIKTIPRLDRNPLNKERLMDLYENQRLTDQEIGEQFGFTASYITDLRHKYGIKTDRSFKHHRKLDIYKLHEEFVDSPLGIKQFARNNGVSYDWLFLKWKAAGLKTRKSKIIKEQKSLVENDRVMQIITGTLLGDAFLSKKNTNYRLELKHASSQLDWLMWKVKKLSTVLEFNVTRLNNQSGFNGQPQYRAISHHHPEFAEIYDEWYDENKKKYISWNTLLGLTPLSISVWILDDGSLNKKRYYISSQSFTKEENQMLCDYMNDYWGLHAKIQKQKENAWCIVFPAKDYNILSGWLKFYFHKDLPTMRYKWGEPNQLTLRI